jgi:hypothetical protein
MRDDEKAVEHSEAQRWHSKEINRGDGFPMMLRKAAHRLAGSGLLGALRIQRNTVRSETSKPSIFQFTVDARCTPCGIFRDHAKD